LIAATSDRQLYFFKFNYSWI